VSLPAGSSIGVCVRRPRCARRHHHGAGITPKAIAPILNELRKQLRNEIQEQIGLLRADITIEKAAEHCEARRRHRASIFHRASSS
jgi:hypothetical protein